MSVRCLWLCQVPHDFPIRSIDFSKNSVYMATNCSGFCLNFIEADSGAAVTDMAKVRSADSGLK